jgi:hypothetical protein
VHSPQTQLRHRLRSILWYASNNGITSCLYFWLQYYCESSSFFLFQSLIHFPSILQPAPSICGPINRVPLL